MKTKTLAIISVTLALVGLLILGAHAAIATDPTVTPTTVPNGDTTSVPSDEEEAGPILVSGLVTLNGDVAPPGVAMSVLGGEILCGNTTTQQGGRFEVLLSSNCEPGTTLRFQLEAIPLVEGPEDVTLMEMGQDATIAFEDLDTSDLLAVGVLTEPEAVEDAVADVVTAAEDTVSAVEALKQELGGEKLVSDKMIIAVVIIALVGALLILALLAKLKYNGRESGKAISFHKEIEALILILVMAALLLFGISGLMTSQGIVAILSLIAGFALGQYASGG